MASAQWNAGEAHGQAKAKTEDWLESAQNTANRTIEKNSDCPESAQHGKEQAAGFLQQTGEQVIHMAQGAIDGVKNTLGINERKK